MRIKLLSGLLLAGAIGLALHAHAEPAHMHLEPAHAGRAACPGEAPTPTVVLATRGGARYGTMQYAGGEALGPKEIALTFDDGPDPKTTERVLDILDRHCIKATFFMVGWYAKARPDLVREVAARGHTIGTHSWLHPNNLRHLPLKDAKREIARGFAAVEEALAAAPPEDQARLAPFFRFPGLNDSAPLMKWLAARNIATVSCEFGADDWLRISAAEVKRRALANIDQLGRGILILHDTKPHTADMLPDLIVALRKRGYRFVQLVPESDARTLAANAPDPLLGNPRTVQ